MVTCSAYGCTSRASKKIPGITFHRFPKKRDIRKLWALAVGRKDWQPTSTSSLCSKHFTEDQFDRTSALNIRLREGAVPSVFDGYPNYLKEINKKLKVYHSSSTDCRLPDNRLPNKSPDIYSDSEETSFQSCNDIPCPKTDNSQASDDLSLENEEAYTLFEKYSVFSHNKTSSATEEISILQSLSPAVNDDSKASTAVILCDVPLPLEITNPVSSKIPPFVSQVAKIVCSSTVNAKENISKVYVDLEHIQKAVSTLPSHEAISDNGQFEQLKRDLELALSWNAKYCKKIKLLEQTIVCQEKKLKHLKDVASFIKKSNVSDI